MACLKYSQSVTAACRNSAPGVSKLFIANYADVTAYAVDTAGTSITGITMSGTTKFYPVVLGKQVGAFIDTSSISLENGTAVSKPKVTFKVQSLDTTIITMYKQLLQADVIVIAKTIDGSYYGLGFGNGLSMSAGTLGTEASAEGFMGATFELSGIESTPFYKVTMATFESTLVA